SLAASFADGFRCLGRGLLRLAVYLLKRPFHLLCLTLDLRFHITGRSSESFLHLSTNVFGSPAEAIFIHGHSPPEFKVKPASARSVVRRRDCRLQTIATIVTTRNSPASIAAAISAP